MMKKVFKKPLYSICFILIIVFIFGLLFPAPMSRPQNLSLKKTCADISILSSALELFKAENYKYPESREGLNALISNPDLSNYPNRRKYFNKNRLVDYWGNSYIYKKISEDDVQIISYGNDGKLGGRGEAKDLTYSCCN